MHLNTYVLFMTFMETPMTRTVLILGASGKIGTHAARAFAAAGWNVRRFDRARDDMLEAAQGCDVIVNGMNPPNYHNWEEIIPLITTQVIAAARASHATVIVPGNVYNFGDTPGEWSEQTPHRPVSRKGRVRAEMEETYRASGVKTIILRAGNFIDPDSADDVVSLMILNGIARGKITYPGSPDVKQPWCYLPDWARAAVMLAERRDQLDTFEDIPFPGHVFTLAELRQAIEMQLGHDVRVTRFPWWAMTLVSPVWELARELREMRYLWETPHTLSSRRLAEVLPDFEPTPFHAVVRGMLPEAEAQVASPAPA